jgi:hypothetical protein
MYSKNPAYFANPQTTMGVRRIGPAPVATPRHQTLGMLSENGNIIPAPIHLAGLSGYTADGAFDGEGMDWKKYAKYGGAGLLVGAIAYSIYWYATK